MLTEELRVLVVDDDEQHASLTEQKLEEDTEYVSVDYVTSSDEAISLVEKNDFDTVVADYDMPGMDGLELTQHVDREYEVPVIIYTGCGSEDIATEAFRNGAEDYVCKGDSNNFLELSNRVENTALGYRAEEELGVFKHAVDNAGHAVKITDVNGRLVYVNSSFEQISGYSEEEVIGEQAKIVRSGEHDEEYYEDMWETILSGENWDGEFLNEDKNGERYWVNQSIRPVEDDSGNIKYFIAVNKDITEEKRENKFKEVVNSILRHDAANKQQIICGKADLALLKLDELDTGELSEEQQEVYEEARENIDEMKEVIGENIDLMKDVRNILGDFEDLDTEPVSLEDEVEGAVDEAQRLADNNSIELETDIEDYTVTGGPLMDRMIYNPLENSITHPENHEIVRVSSEEVDGEKGDFVLRISDDGEGFPEDFSIQEGVKGENSGSTGMGTWLSSEIADSIGIEMETGESEMGGAEYRFFMENWDNEFDN